MYLPYVFMKNLRTACITLQLLANSKIDALGIMAASRKLDKVLVTGATSFLSTHLIKQLLEQGCHVRGTVLAHEVAMSDICKICPEADTPQLDLVEANLDDKECWISAVEGCSHVIHVATAFIPKELPDESELITSAVDGTVNVLEACRGRVKRIVLISSTMAMAEYSRKYENDTVTEESFPLLENTTMVYAKMIVLAERAAWEFMHQLEEDEKLELVVLTPGFMMGPSLTSQAYPNLTFPKLMLEGAKEVFVLPKMFWPAVDVRDVATACVRALTSWEAVDKRITIVSGHFWIKEMAVILKEEFKDQGYKVGTKEAPNFLLKFMSFFAKNIRPIVPSLGHQLYYSNSRMENILGLKSPLPIRQAIIDMCDAGIEHGHIRKTDKYRALKQKAD